MMNSEVCCYGRGISHCLHINQVSTKIVSFNAQASSREKEELLVWLILISSETKFVTFKSDSSIAQFSTSIVFNVDNSGGMKGV